MQLKTLKAHRPRHLRVDDYEPQDDPERRKRVEAHRRRIHRELKQHSNQSRTGG